MKHSETLLLDPERVKPFADQPRKRFRGIAKLAECIRLVGQVTPIVVTPIQEKGFDVELLDGERRLQACRLGKMRIKVVVEDDVKAADRFALAVAANFCRQPHDSVEIAEAIARLRSQGRSTEDIGGIFGKTISWVTQYSSLLTLHPDIRQMLTKAGDEKRESRIRHRQRGRMTLSLALLLVPLKQDRQVQMARRIIKGKMSMEAARSFVRRSTAEAGEKVGKKTSPRAKFIVLFNLFDTFRHRLDQFVDMPHVQLKEIMLSSNAKDRKLLDERLGELSDGLAGLWAALEKLEKAKRK